MKKILIMTCATVCAAFANAAAINWASNQSGMVLPGGGTAGGESEMAMYVFTIEKAAYDDLAGASDISKSVWNSYGSSLSSASVSALDEEGGFCLSDAAASYASSQSAYAAIIFTYTANGESDPSYYKGNIGTYTWGAEESADVTIFNMDSNIGGGSGAALGWTATPEPTSGLLLLVGLAGLALKRKRA